MTPVRDVVITGDVRSHERQQGAPPAGAAAKGSRSVAAGSASLVPAPRHRRAARTRHGSWTSTTPTAAAGRMRLVASLDASQLDRLEASIAEHRPARVILVERRCSGDQIQRLLECCLRHDLPMQVPEPSHNGDPVAILSGPDRVAYAVHPSRRAPAAYRVKRVVDVVAAAGLLARSLAVLRRGRGARQAGLPGPVFYVSWRVGVGEQPFPCYKFRTMYVGRRRAPGGAREPQRGRRLPVQDPRRPASHACRAVPAAHLARRAAAARQRPPRRDEPRRSAAAAAARRRAHGRAATAPGTPSCRA